ncbi:MAG: hypothetical protein CM15mP78_16740 [Candidatus Poseidoniales archaeon]|nr:MAG: hypothetical protein CM15mP78_16740 [Candidatus Poseidoniales archaeon]
MEFPIFEAAKRIDAHNGCTAIRPHTAHQLESGTVSHARSGELREDEFIGQAVDMWLIFPIMLICFSIESHVDRMIDRWY